jgi:hypothetical protein
MSRNKAKLWGRLDITNRLKNDMVHLLLIRNLQGAYGAMANSFLKNDISRMQHFPCRLVKETISITPEITYQHTFDRTRR